MDNSDASYDAGVAWKLKGGTPLVAFVSDGIWLGGVRESRAHQPFVAIGPEDWESEEELSFFRDANEVEAFVKRLRAASAAAFD